MLTETELRQLTVALFHASQPMYPGPRSNIDLSKVLSLLGEYSDAPDFVYQIDYDTPVEGMTRQRLTMGHKGEKISMEVPIPPPPEGK